MWTFGCERSTSATTRREKSSFTWIVKRIIGMSATGRMRMRLLNDLKAVQREKSANQLQMRMGKRHVVALEFLVHRRLGSRADYVVEEERGDEERDDQRREKSSDPEKNRMLSIRAHRTPAR